MPKLQAENVIPAKIYAKVQDQHIIGPNGPVGLRQEPVWKWIEELKVDQEDREYCFDLVRASYGAFLEELRERQEAERLNRKHAHTR